MFDDEEMNSIINNMVLAGYLEIDGVDGESGEFLYKVSPSLYDQIPDLGERLQAAFLDEIYNLWIKGMVNMDATKTNPIVSLTENAFDEEKVAELTIEERHTLFVIMQAMRQED
jgi:hypothetical protein